MNDKTSLVCIAAFCVQFAVGGALGQGIVYTWEPGGTVNGEFGELGNWDDEKGFPGVPGESDIALFNLPTIYTVDFTQDHLTDRVLVRSGQVTFQLAPPSQPGSSYEYMLGNPFNQTPSIVIGMAANDTAGLTVTGGALRGVFMDVGLESGSFGMLEVSGPNAVLENQWQLRIGNKGAALLDVLDGAAVSNHVASIGAGQGSFGQATISGADSRWICAGTLAVGKGGFGSLFIDDAAEVRSANAIVAQQSSSVGEVEVVGSGTLWQVTGTLDVGFAGKGDLVIRDGAVVSNAVFASLAAVPFDFHDSEIQGRAVVQGDGSLWLIDGDLYNGIVANGELVLARGGRVEIAGNLYEGGAWDNPISTIRLELGSSDDYADAPAISLGGESLWESPVQVMLVDEFQPQLGDSFHAVASMQGAEFTFDLPALGPDLHWQVISAGSDIHLNVVGPDVLGDLDGNGVIDVSDLLVLLANWGPCPTGSCAADLNDDGSIDVSDLLMLLGNWG